MSHEKPTESDLADDVIWGGENIAAYLGITPAQFYYLNRIGAFGDAVRKHSHRILTGSKRGLKQQFTSDTSA